MHLESTHDRFGKRINADILLLIPAKEHYKTASFCRIEDGNVAAEEPPTNRAPEPAKKLNVGACPCRHRMRDLVEDDHAVCRPKADKLDLDGQDGR